MTTSPSGTQPVHHELSHRTGSEHRVGLVYDEGMQRHYDYEEVHYEKPERISAIYETLKVTGIVEKCEIVAARKATIRELSCVHTEEYINSMRLLKNQTERSLRILANKYGSVYFNKEGSWPSALLAVGSCIELSLKVAKGELGAGAAIIRPPGHHAEADGAMGFCLFNNVAIAVHNLVHCQPALGIKRVLIVDWDVHHGNGTQHLFWNDPSVLYFSIHRYDHGRFYPGNKDGNFDKIGEGAGKGYNVNVPWQGGDYGDMDYLLVFDHLLMPIAREFNPDMVFISGGFDSALGDPLGGCKITPVGYFELTKRLMTLASGRLVLALEGGYSLMAISASCLACLKALLGESCKGKVSLEIQLSTWSIITKVCRKICPYWSSLPKSLPKKPPEHLVDNASPSSPYNSNSCEGE